MATLDAIADAALQRFQPAWTTRAYLLARAGDPTAAAQAYQRAIELTTACAVAEYPRAQPARLQE